jgi:hypothetical protein
MKVGNDLLDDLIGRTAVAPSQPGAIVRADTRGLPNPRLHERPVDRERTAASLEQHSRAAGAHTVDVQLASVDLDQAAWSGILQRLSFCGHDQEHEERCDHRRAFHAQLDVT